VCLKKRLWFFPMKGTKKIDPIFPVGKQSCFSLFFILNYSRKIRQHMCSVSQHKIFFYRIEWFFHFLSPLFFDNGRLGNLIVKDKRHPSASCILSIIGWVWLNWGQDRKYSFFFVVWEEGNSENRNDLVACFRGVLNWFFDRKMSLYLIQMDFWGVSRFP